MKAFGIVVLALLASVAAQAETPAEKAVREARNYDTLLQYYPKRALAAGEQGLVGFTIRLDKAGHPTNCEVTHSSGHRQLDDETCQLMLIHGVFKPVKDSEGNKVNQVTEGVVNWKIPGSTAKVAAPVKVTAANAPEKMICKRELRQGTLAGYERTCMTKSDWQRLSDQMKEPWEEIKRNAKPEAIELGPQENGCMKAIGFIGLALLACASAQAETPAEQAAREAKNREFVLKHYPSRALAAGEHGIVYFQVKLDRDGRLIGCEVTQSSGFPRLDVETCKLMVAHGVFKPVRDETGRLINPTHDGAIKWALPDGVRPAEVPKKLATLQRPEKLVCRRTQKVGSWAKTERRCLTLREWDQADAYSRDEIRRMQDDVKPTKY